MLQQSPAPFENRPHKAAFHINRSPYYGSKSKQLSPGFQGVEGQTGGANLILTKSSVQKSFQTIFRVPACFNNIRANRCVSDFPNHFSSRLGEVFRHYVMCRAMHSMA